MVSQVANVWNDPLTGAKTFRFWAMWTAVVAMDLLAWPVLSKAYPEIYGAPAPRTFRIFLAAFIMLDFAQGSVTGPTHGDLHCVFAKAAIFCYMVALSLLLHGCWFARADFVSEEGRQGHSRLWAMLSMATASHMLFLLMGAIMTFLAIRPDHYGHPSAFSLTEYAGLGSIAVTLALLEQVLPLPPPCAFQRLPKAESGGQKCYATNALPASSV